MVRIGDEVRMSHSKKAIGRVVYVHPRRRYFTAEIRYHAFDKYQPDVAVRESFIMNRNNGNYINCIGE